MHCANGLPARVRAYGFVFLAIAFSGCATTSGSEKQGSAGTEVTAGAGDKSSGGMQTGYAKVPKPVSQEMLNAALGDDRIEERLQMVVPKAGRYETVHRTIYRVHQRVATTFRAGRMLLAGDAAHLNNPLGGMGMNGGIHDGFNLAEKLAAVLRGEKPEAELERYERQRRPVALEYVNTITIANKRNLEMRDAEEQRRWRAELERATRDRAAERELMLKISMIASLRKYECA